MHSQRAPTRQPSAHQEADAVDWELASYPQAHDIAGMASHGLCKQAACQVHLARPGC